MKLTWKDPRAIAEELYDENPDLDPLTISVEKLHAMIVALPDFDDDPEGGKPEWNNRKSGKSIGEKGNQLF